MIHYGATQDAGTSSAVGNLIPITADTMASHALEIVLEGLEFYRVWPAKKKLESEIGAMDSRCLSKFVRDHQFVDVLKRDKVSVFVRPNHRVGRGWRGITGYMRDEIRLPLPTSQEQFFGTLTKAFELAT